ncbi:GNAT family N-acetyltransferase [Nocardioides taihuensis]|uniref:GNAT family N-acetyltransferase n=1 Tax=Nocardioides taihuensis TaxID=1835606 RepID=A0ABW0BMX3_9ACTN
MDVHEFGPDDAPSVAAFAEVADACHRVDAPWLYPVTPYRVEMDMRHGWDGEVGRYFLATDEGVPVGALNVNTSEHDNLDLAWVDLRVHPDHRRRGHGRALLGHATDTLRAIGRGLLSTSGWDAEAVRAFAAATGLAEKAREVQRRQVLADLPPGLVEAVHAESLPHAAGYELLRIPGYAPDDLLADLARVTESINDAPIDDLEFEDEKYSADRVRGYERAQQEAGFRLYRVVARHRGTGELAGHSVAVVDAETPTICYQHDTAVARDHRGHRLGLLLKADLLRWLADEEPQLATVDTWNAESNTHMIGVNERLGYRPVGRELVFQLRVSG